MPTLIGIISMALDPLIPLPEGSQNMLNTNIYLPKELTSGWKLGEAPTPETIRQGTVRMEEHPDYEAAIQKAKDAGFEIILTNEASVKWTELYDLNQKFFRLERLLNVVARMRYLDLEHELGHLDQFSRFGDKVPPPRKENPIAKRIQKGCRSFGWHHEQQASRHLRVSQSPC